MLAFYAEVPLLPPELWTAVAAFLDDSNVWSLACTCRSLQSTLLSAGAGSQCFVQQRLEDCDGPVVPLHGVIDELLRHPVDFFLRHRITFATRQAEKALARRIRGRGDRVAAQTLAVIRGRPVLQLKLYKSLKKRVFTDPELLDEILVNEEVRVLLMRDGAPLALIQTDLRTSDVYLAAQSVNILTFEEIPSAKLTERMCLLLVSEEPWLLEAVPLEHRTQAVCIRALSECWSVLDCVPEEMQTESFYLACVQQHPYLLSNIPKTMLTASMCMAAVQRNGFVLQDVPIGFIDEALCTAAVAHRPLALQYVPCEH